MRIEEVLARSPDWDAPLVRVRRFLKSANTGDRRRRVVPDVFSNYQGRGQPRQGFLPLEVMRAVYLRSEVVRACVDTIIEIVCTQRWAVRFVDEEKSKWLRQRRPEEFKAAQKRIQWAEQFFRRPNESESLRQFLRRLLRDLLIYDAAAFEIIRFRHGDAELPLELGVMAGDTVEIECDDSGTPIAYWQSYNVRGYEEFKPHEIGYLQLHPNSWSPYGISPIETAYINITADLEANGYNAAYFAKNGIPPALLAVLGVSNNEFLAIKSQLQQAAQDNPWNVHIFRAHRNPDGNAQEVFQLQPLTAISNRDMQFVELLNHVIRRVCMAYRVSPSTIGFTEDMHGGLGSGLAETQLNISENKGIGPILHALEEVFTEKVLRGVCGWTDLEFAFQQTTTPQEQMEYQRSLEELNLGARTINEHRSQFGGRDPVEWGDLPLRPPPNWVSPQEQQMQQMQMMQQMQQPQLPPEIMQAMQQQMQKSARRVILKL